MEIIKPHDAHGWLTVICRGRWVQAKVYNTRSAYGVKSCRISKLAIGKFAYRDKLNNFFDQMCYNYDRGLDFHNKKLLSRSKLKKIIKDLNKLPALPL